MRNPATRRSFTGSISAHTSLTLVLLMFLAVGAEARPATIGLRTDNRRSGIAFSYGRQEIRPRFALEARSRGVVNGTVRQALPGGTGLWARARAGGPWSGDGSSWLLTDLEFGPYCGISDVWRRLDMDGWLTVAAPAGKAPEREPWYQGLREWSLGVGAGVSARVLGEGGAPLWLCFDISYMTQGRPDWIYLPRHSVAFADSAGALAGSVLAWQAGLELRGKRATISTAILREEPLDAGALISKEEKPLYLVQSACVKVRGDVVFVVEGELLLSGDDKNTAYGARSLLPSWCVSLGLSWEYSL